MLGTLNQKEGNLGEPGIKGSSTFAVPLLLGGLQGKDVALSRKAIELLGRFGPGASQAIPILEQVVEQPAFCLEGRIALARITMPDTAESLIEKLKAEDKAKAVVIPTSPSRPLSLFPSSAGDGCHDIATNPAAPDAKNRRLVNRIPPDFRCMVMLLRRPRVHRCKNRGDAQLGVCVPHDHPAEKRSIAVN